MLSGINVTDAATAAQAAVAIQNLGVKSVIITMGAMGCVIYDKGEITLVPAQKVEAVDTTAAGDVFCGALAVALAEGGTLFDAVNFASRAAAISVTRMGAQPSIPYRKELITGNIQLKP